MQGDAPSSAGSGDESHTSATSDRRGGTPPPAPQRRQQRLHVDAMCDVGSDGDTVASDRPAQPEKVPQPHAVRSASDGSISHRPSAAGTATETPSRRNAPSSSPEPPETGSSRPHRDAGDDGLLLGMRRRSGSGSSRRHPHTHSLPATPQTRAERASDSPTSSPAPRTAQRRSHSVPAKPMLPDALTHVVADMASPEGRGWRLLTCGGDLRILTPSARKDGPATLRCSIVVRAPAARVFSHLMDVHEARPLWDPTHNGGRIVERLSPFDDVIHTRIRPPPLLGDMDWCVQTTTKVILTYTSRGVP